MIVGGVPNPGFYKTRLVKGGPFVPVRIWHGAPLDPGSPRFLDRSPRWQALANGHRVDLLKVWPYCERQPIALSEYRYMLALARWSANYAPHEPAARPHEPINLLTAALPF